MTIKQQDEERILSDAIDTIRRRNPLTKAWKTRPDELIRRDGNMITISQCNSQAGPILLVQLRYDADRGRWRLYTPKREVQWMITDVEPSLEKLLTAFDNGEFDDFIYSGYDN